MGSLSLGVSPGRLSSPRFRGAWYSGAHDWEVARV